MGEFLSLGGCARVDSLAPQRGVRYDRELFWWSNGLGAKASDFCAPRMIKMSILVLTQNQSL